ncbi:methyltransferase domain-containing protein [Agromyces sp. CCNWLW213]|uniref:class I SAM-dependent methyltransferase n=1 Tax=Agromyces sp. CCNWLW213 TaxID=3128541 RepID=UPI0030762A50
MTDSLRDETRRGSDLRRLTVADGGADAVLAWYSIIHTRHDDLAGVCAEFRRVLRPDGAVPPMSMAAILMSPSTVIVAADAQLLRRLDLRPEASARAVLERAGPAVSGVDCSLALWPPSTTCGASPTPCRAARSER